MENYRAAPIGEQDMAMLRYVEKVTVNPSSVTEEEIGSLRNAGYNDNEILEICQITAYFAFVNRLASGLGVELENENVD